MRVLLGQPADHRHFPARREAHEMTTEPSHEPDPPDPGPLDRHRARRNPEDAVDALEKQVLGGPEHRLDGGYPDDLSPSEQNGIDQSPDDEHPRAGSTDQEPPVEAAFAIDIDPEDQGSPDVAPRSPD
jgi:hypothetical protein